MTKYEDQQDISDVLLRFATGIDRRDWPLFHTAFTEDCWVQMGDYGTFDGVDAIAEFATASTPRPATRCTASPTKSSTSTGTGPVPVHTSTRGSQARMALPVSMPSVCTTTNCSAPVMVGASNAVPSPKCESQCPTTADANVCYANTA
jgi:SnoaL-like domain